MRPAYLLPLALLCGVADGFSLGSMSPLITLRTAATNKAGSSAGRYSRLGSSAGRHPPRVSASPRRAALHSSVLGSIMSNAGVKDLQRIAVVGGGPAGLATAIMLARRGFKSIEVSLHKHFIRLHFPGLHQGGTSLRDPLV
ncbi:hypothetical protein T484DRAFT_1745864 [Baffinella frigidus]|nr:hypothetical protein T484DRAFT_1745864 [Cryptophyta sp. CCMP2293]